MADAAEMETEGGVSAESAWESVFSGFVLVVADSSVDCSGSWEGGRIRLAARAVVVGGTEGEATESFMTFSFSERRCV